ncbi:hypothetical protein AMTR_s00086p00134640, partial [Amborella trichopoda]
CLEEIGRPIGVSQSSGVGLKIISASSRKLKGGAEPKTSKEESKVFSVGSARDVIEGGTGMGARSGWLKKSWWTGERERGLGGGGGVSERGKGVEKEELGEGGSQEMRSSAKGACETTRNDRICGGAMVRQRIWDGHDNGVTTERMSRIRN